MNKIISTLIMKHSLNKCLTGYRIFCTKITRSSDMKFINQTSEREDEIVPIYKQALVQGTESCITDSFGRHTYRSLYHNSKRLSRQISNICGSGSNLTVGLFCSYDILTLLIVWASWMSGQKVVFLNRDFTRQQLYDLVKKLKVSLIISSDYCKHSKSLAYESDIPLIHVDHKFVYTDFIPDKLNKLESLDNIDENEALILYSQQTFSKIYILTHKELFNKLKMTSQSWTLAKYDNILYMCPSFHSHNEEFMLSLNFSLSGGSQLNIINPLDTKAAWLILLGINIPYKDRVNVLMAEPSVYQQLILQYKTFAGNKKIERHIRNYCFNNVRFMLSCFNTTDTTVSSDWYKITGHYLQDCRFSI